MENLEFDTSTTKGNTWNYYEKNGMKYIYKRITSLIDELKRVQDLGFTFINGDLTAFKEMDEESIIKLEIEALENKLKEVKKHKLI